jgi:hypothetical protein
VPFKNENIEIKTIGLTTYTSTSAEVDVDGFPSTTPGSAYLADRNLIDTTGKILGNSGEVIYIGTFIVSTNDGWKTYNPVYTTHIFRPNSAVINQKDDGTYTTTYQYNLINITDENYNSQNFSAASVDVDYIDTDNTVISFTPSNYSKEWKDFIHLDHPCPRGGLTVRLQDPLGEVNPISYKWISNTKIEVSFWPAITGTYSILIKYGYRPVNNAG